MSSRLVTAARAVVAYHKGELGAVVPDSIRCELLAELEAAATAEASVLAAESAQLDRLGRTLHALATA
jgi:hypothetical protein